MSRRHRHSRRCGCYMPGHQVHHIQARLAAAELAESPTGQIRVIDERGIHVQVGDQIHRYTNHNRDEARQALAEHGAAVRVQERRGLLWFDTKPVSVNLQRSTPSDPVSAENLEDRR